ncbi:uncharacterized protein PRCAT00004762001 [Priceomyces carsonii]|uniref:uncharacterized protein n=1 Tax=Priceomyces carsonii TaxID=28549 RepID=UPI002EDA4C5C|nr:unnamed protein product [Priceomyces carsonii]
MKYLTMFFPFFMKHPVIVTLITYLIVAMVSYIPLLRDDSIGICVIGFVFTPLIAGGLYLFGCESIFENIREHLIFTYISERPKSEDDESWNTILFEINRLVEKNFKIREFYSIHNLWSRVNTVIDSFKPEEEVSGWNKVLLGAKKVRDEGRRIHDQEYEDRLPPDVIRMLDIDENANDFQDKRNSEDPDFSS